MVLARALVPVSTESEPKLSAKSKDPREIKEEDISNLPPLGPSGQPCRGFRAYLRSQGLKVR